MWVCVQMCVPARACAWLCVSCRADLCVSVCEMCVLACVQLYVCPREAVCARAPARRRRGPAGRQGAELCRWGNVPGDARRGGPSAGAQPEAAGPAHAGQARAGRGAGPGRALGSDGDRGPPLTCLRGSGCRARPSPAAAENPRALPTGTSEGNGGKGGRAGSSRVPGARSTMILLALGAGRRLDVLHPSGTVFLQTLLWIVCAAVCGAEQYFNVEVRTRRPPSRLGRS